MVKTLHVFLAAQVNLLVNSFSKLKSMLTPLNRLITFAFLLEIKLTDAKLGENFKKEITPDQNYTM